MPLKPPYKPLDDVIPAASAGSWTSFARSFRDPTQELAPPWADVFRPLRLGAIDDIMAVGQIGQSLDGRIATETGHSHYINGAGGIEHLHRLRALVDAVVIGVGTALADDPLLTVRRCEGAHPARVVLDPKGRLTAGAKVFAGDGVRRMAIVAQGTHSALPAGIETIALPAAAGRIAPRDILTALAERGMKRILIEGGADTVSCFLAAGCLDRLHVMVAPIILGSGRAGIALPPIARADEALRPTVRMFKIGDDVLFDCDLSAQRVAVGRTKIST